MSDDHFVYFHNVRNNIIIRSLFHSPSAFTAYDYDKMPSDQSPGDE